MNLNKRETNIGMQGIDRKPRDPKGKHRDSQGFLKGLKGIPRDAHQGRTAHQGSLLFLSKNQSLGIQDLFCGTPTAIPREATCKPYLLKEGFHILAALGVPWDSKNDMMGSLGIPRLGNPWAAGPSRGNGMIPRANGSHLSVEFPRIIPIQVKVLFLEVPPKSPFICCCD